MISKLFEVLNKQQKIISGLVIRKTHTKTAMCEVTKVFFNRGKYACLDKKVTKYMIHDPEDQCSVGDFVHFKPCRPLSKRKSHVLDKIVKKNPLEEFIKANPQYLVTPAEIKQQAQKDKINYTHMKDL
ncbi:hypothetical protein DLAC_11620 [Tieghemostelium lacteum]|uniref:Ribosomal protein S17 n=1 Tax=Tieghemostelium lacteum TaxID=361077 RepID=A0A151ZJ19_TIELA|nr:hypothetical protein DLAC_11620 [Tieghemostelium lacteum]|eukprot:KYQ93889.1 hypothetical protein DLAC_11620 [Tieghemostelium lacteum]